MDTDKIISEIKSWIGTPYRNFSRGKGIGTDCAYYIIQSFRAYGMLLKFDYKHTLPTLYRDSGCKYVLNKMIEAGLKKVIDFPIASVLLFQTGKDYDHIGIYIGKNNMITCTVSSGVFECPLWMDKFIAAFEVIV
jgi:cell wall-associated NlpC family hydrolase